MNFLRKFTDMLRKDRNIVSEPEYPGSDFVSFPVEARVTDGTLISDLLPVFMVTGDSTERENENSSRED